MLIKCILNGQRNERRNEALEVKTAVAVALDEEMGIEVLASGPPHFHVTSCEGGARQPQVAEIDM